ncbi:MAG: carboxypeptidase-like regulatory domain-containing protein [Bacteroidales bacterium]|nr:carboxypeptidase-like regulatory domain-containing protein [Bacteroidales bacterium]MBN2820257.1 carboxypeptidase-like regulatory domain-containing protein [Bacteroidales bacterium]
MNTKYYILVLLNLIVLSPFSYTQGLFKVEGQVIDSKTKNPLEYATISLKEGFIGTISNKQGLFCLYIPDSLVNSATLEVNYLGYYSFQMNLYDFKKDGKNTLALKEKVNEIKEVIIKPLTPLQIVTKSLEYYDTFYSTKPYIIKGFYMEEIKENGKYIDYKEAYVDLYNPSNTDTAKSLACLHQVRTRDDLAQMQFLSRYSEQKHEKSLKKSNRKGEDIDTNQSQALQIMFGGPQSIPSDDLIKNIRNYYNKKNIKHFILSFEPNTIYSGREIYVIRCISTKPLDNTLIDAKLFIDCASFALIAVKSKSEITIPALAKPLLALFRIEVDKLLIQHNTEYKLINETWYPSKTIVIGYADATKKYRGKYTEHSILEITKAFVSTDFQLDNAVPFRADQILQDNSIEKELQNYDPEFWKNKNRISYKIESL